MGEFGRRKFPLMSRLVVIVLMSVLISACAGTESEMVQLEWCLDHPTEVIGMRDSLGLLGDVEIWLEEHGMDVRGVDPDARLSEQDLTLVAEWQLLVTHPDPVTAEENRVEIRVNWLTNSSDGIATCQAAYDAR